MARDEIMKMDERELYKSVANEVLWLDIMEAEDRAVTSMFSKREALWLCYQAEEKIKEMGFTDHYWSTLLDILNLAFRPGAAGLFDFVHAHPRDRARAILLTIEEKEVPDG